MTVAIHWELTTNRVIITNKEPDIISAEEYRVVGE